MADSTLHNDCFLTASEFFSRAQERLTFDVPAGFADPNVIPRHDQQDADPAVVAAIAGVRPSLAAVLVPIIERDEPSVLLTQRTAQLADHAGQISFPGGKIDASDESPVAAALREAEEEIALPRRFVEPIGYLDVHMTPSAIASCRCSLVCSRALQFGSIRERLTMPLKCRSLS